MASESSRGLPVWLLLLGMFGAIIGFAWSEQDYVAASALAAIAISGLWGYYLGAIRLIGFFGSLAGAYASAFPIGQWLEPHIAKNFDCSPAVTRMISLITGGGLVFIASCVVIAVVSRRLLDERPRLEAANRFLGFVIGGLQGSAAMLLLLSGILFIEPHAKQRVAIPRSEDDNRFARAIALRVIDVGERTRQSTVAPLIQAYNPFERIPKLIDLPRTGVAIRDQGTKSVTEQRSQTKSDVRRAIESLAQDPQLRKLAESKQPLDKQTAVSLLNHPGIAKLLEQPDLMQQLSEAMNDLGVESPQR